nr:DUF3631 domain-containing protein [Mycobacterium marinum]
MLHIAVGYDGYFDPKGKYKHREWVPSHFDWPAEADRAEREILREAATADVYVCPTLMVAEKRAKGAAADRLNVKADIDGEVDLDKVREVGGFAVLSGSPGHAHVYVPLAETVPAHHYTALCRALGAYLGHADSKIADNDVLRPPGTHNHKPTALDGSPPAPVDFVIRPSGVRVDPQTLAALLGVELAATPAPTTADVAVVEAVDLALYPHVRTALGKATGDRSADTMRVVGACHNAGLTLAQTRYVVTSRDDLRTRLNDRNDDDVLTCWLKATDARQNVKEVRPDQISNNKSSPVSAPKPPPAQPVNGAELLDDIRDFLARFVVYPNPHGLVAHVLWIVHTWLMCCWESTPRMAFLSPEPGSGKSRALEVTEPLIPNPVHAVNTTSAYLFRKVADSGGKPTILYDEIDTVFGPRAKENEDIRGMLNAGHRKGAKAGRCVVRGKNIETEELDAYCAVMLAGLDDLPDTLMSRSIVNRMQRRAPTEPVEPWRPRINGPKAEALRQRIEAWADSVRDRAGGLWPEMPPGVQDRDADVWEAPLAVAELAGGHWPETARVAAVTLVTASKAGAPSVGVQLLRDLKVVFDTQGEERLSTESLLTELRGIEESPWGVIRRGEPLDARGLAQRLRKYGIKPDLQRTNEGVSRGYTRAQFADAWSRYACTESVTSVTSDIPGAEPHPLCGSCQATLERPESIARGHCAECALRQGGAA